MPHRGHDDRGELPAPLAATAVLYKAAGCVLVCVFVLLWAAGCTKEQRPVAEKPAAGPSSATSGRETPGAKPEKPGAVVSSEIAEALAAFNRGAALLEQYRYSDAAEAFEECLKRAPDWIAARHNLGVAYLNLQEKRGAIDYLEKARQAFETVLAADPQHRHARFCLGLYHQHLGHNAEALDCFEKVYQADPDDPFAAYKYAEALIAAGRNDEGTRVLEKGVQADPGFVSGMYRLAMQYQRAREPKKAMPLFKRFQQLNSAELAAGSYTVRKVYGTAGKYYTALGADNLPLPPVTVEQVRIVFSPEVKRFGPGDESPRGDGTLPGLAVGDVDGDGDLDLCVASPSGSREATLWRNDGKGNFERGPVLAEGGVSPCFGDVDNDGDLDLWLGRQGPDLLLENDGQGKFAPAEPKGVSADQVPSTAARLWDIDSDGDLDLVSFQATGGTESASAEQKTVACRVWNNNRDGSYEDIAERLGLASAVTGIGAVLYDDLDNDRDLDLLLFPTGSAGPVAWVNDRVWQYHLLGSEQIGLDVSGARCAVSADVNGDGRRDVLVLAASGTQLYVNRGGFRFEPDEKFAAQYGSLQATGAQFADMDNDGDFDLVIADARRREGVHGPLLLLNQGPEKGFVDAASLDAGLLLSAIEFPGPASCVVGDFTGNGRCDLLLAPCSGQPMLLENVTAGGHWIAIDLKGTRGRDKKSRSNNSAIGAWVEVRTGRVFQQHIVGAASGPVAMAPLRIHAGLGENTKIQWLRILWPDAVLQAEVEVPGDQVMAITEIQRKVSSCPHLFAWTGEQFEFVSDFGGVGGLGYLVAPGQYARPDPTEYVPLPRLAPRNGHYELRVVEPLEEVVYFDEAKLLAVDHPAGTTVLPNEMAAVGAPPPEFELFCIERWMQPQHAVDHRGKDVTDALRKRDRLYGGATRPDPRFVGYAEDHFVEVDFGRPLAELEPGQRVVLCLYGWVEYGYSSTNFAAAQAGLRLRAPTIRVWRGGRWVELFAEVGYPAGVEHVMTLELTGKLQPGDRKLRIDSNMELYWDRVAIGILRQDNVLRVHELPAVAANLRLLGYPREYSPDGRLPNLLDYTNVDRLIPWRRQVGRYTRYGPVGELLEKADDCYVIMGPGDELALRFAADSLDPVPAGFRRSFLLKSDSYCKDMDLCTAHPDTVEPLPFHGMSGYPYGAAEHYPDNPLTRQYRLEYNTRMVHPR